jgi:hypothetical protein
MAQASTTATTSASPTAETGFSLVLITAAVLAASLMQGLDTTIVDVALLSSKATWA